MSNLNTSRWLSGMNCVGYTPQQHVEKKSQQMLGNATRNDNLLKRTWMRKIDDNNENVRQGEQHLENHRNSVESTIPFHVNRNSIHTWRHTNAVNYRNETYRKKQEKFEAQAQRKKAQTDNFIERRTRLLVDMAGDERETRCIALRNHRARTLAELNHYRKTSLPFCAGDSKYKY